MQRLFILSVFLLSIFCSSCIQNVEDLTTDDGTIDPEDVSYSADIQPIFSSSCGGGGCHLGSSTNGVNLSTYNSVINSIGAVYGDSIVAKGDPDGSPLVDKIEANPKYGGRMPSGGPYLTPKEINEIRAWILGGAKNN